MTRFVRTYIFIATMAFLLFANFAQSFAQGTCPIKELKVSRIQGVVVSQGREDDPIKDTKIELFRLGNPETLISTTTTDENGYFEIGNAPIGEYRLVVYFMVKGEAVAPSYNGLIVSVKKTNAKKSNRFLDIWLGANCFEHQTSIRKS